jgi:hypothetical protein
MRPPFSILLWLAVGLNALAQGDPHISYVYPAGGRQGTTFQATVGGQNLHATAVYFSGKGVSATITKQERQLTPRELIPFISDAVPGWFKATVTIYNAKGEEMAFTGDYQFHPDPVMFYKVPTSGNYVLEIKDELYRGREDFVYRVSIGELPFITGVFPLGGRIGTQTSLAATGWNLPFDQTALDLRDKAPGVYPLSQHRLANRIMVSADTLPECFEKEPNDTAESAEPVTLPIIINGRINHPRPRGRSNGGAGGRHDASIRLPSSRSRPGTESCGFRTLSGRRHRANPQRHTSPDPHRRHRPNSCEIPDRPAHEQD